MSSLLTVMTMGLQEGILYAKGLSRMELQSRQQSWFRTNYCSTCRSQFAMQFWAEALAALIYVWNCCPSAALKWQDTL